MPHGSQFVVTSASHKVSEELKEHVMSPYRVLGVSNQYQGCKMIIGTGSICISAGRLV